jgi:hypothetical protein
MTIILCHIFIAIASIVIGITMACRANDERAKLGLRWHIRKLGFVMAGAGAPAMAFTLVFAPGYALPFLAVTMIGHAFVFLTTPNQKPWHVWVWKGGDERL